MRIGWRGYADYAFTGGSDPAVDVWLGGISEFEALLGFAHSVLPLALPLFGIEPLHGAAVARDDEALLLLGGSGAGKSTIATNVCCGNYVFLADDTCAIDARGRVLAGPRLAAHRKPPPDTEPLAPYEEKTLVAPERARTTPARPMAVVSLMPSPGSDLVLRELAGAEAFSEILSHVRSPGTFTEMRAQRQLEVVAQLTSLLVSRVTYDHDRHAEREVADLISAWADAAPAPHSADPIPVATE